MVRRRRDVARLLVTLAPTAPDIARAQRRTLAVLSGAQVLGGLGVGAVAAVGGLLAAGVAGSEGAAGLASTANVVGAAIAALPLVRVTDRHGRRAGLACGLLIAAVGAAAVVVGAAGSSLPMLFLGFLLTGAATAAGLQARYAATDLARQQHRARDLSIVVWATTLGAVAGPNLADPTGLFALQLGLPELSGGYLLALLTFGAAALGVMVLLRPDPLLTARARAVDAGQAHAPRPALRHSLSVVNRSADARLALAAIVVAHTAMVSVMVMTPIHMQHVDVSLVIIGVVISVHILGMYAFSPLVGLASDRIGRRPVLAGGAILLLAACLVSGTAAADDSIGLGVGLFLLGLGWSCGLVAGSTLLTESVPEPERPGVQGASDLLMNTAGAVGGAVAGVIFAVATYGWLALIAAVPAALLLMWLLRARVRPAASV
jgi:MFS family permease